MSATATIEVTSRDEPGRPGRSPMLPGLTNIPSPAWLSCWDGYELDMVSRGLSPASIKTRRSTILMLARYATTHGYEPEAITKQHMKNYFLAQFKDRTGSGPAALYADLKSFWDWYSREYEVPSPMAAIARPKGKAEPVHVLSPDEVGAVVEAARKSGPRDLAIVSLMLSSGLRRNELCALDVSDVDVRARTVLVRCGKGRKQRITCMDESAAKNLWSWLRRDPGRDGPLFTSRTGTRITGSALNQLISRLGTEAGIRLHPHMIRHAWCHYMLSGGIGEQNLMALAGWSNPAMLARYAASAAAERAIEAAQEVQVSRVVRSRKS